MIDRVAEPGRARADFWVMVALLVAGFLVWTFAELRAASDPKWEDTEGYLSHSLYIAEHGGLAGYLKQSFAGTFPIVERHALYMLTLAPFAERTPAFFWNAKLTNLATGVVALVTLVWMVARRYGQGPAVLAGLLYAVSHSLVVASSHVNHEPHLAFCALWTWWLLTEPGRTATAAGPPNALPTPPTEMPAATWRWALAGVWLGLAYMVKSSAILIPVAVVVAGLWRERLRFLAGPRIWVFLLAALLVSSPHFVRNLRGFDAFLYEGINSHIMWMDSWAELGEEDTILYYDRYGVHHIDRNGLPTGAEHLREHGLDGMAKRFLRGVFDQVTRVTPQAVSPAFRAPNEGLSTAWGRSVKAWGLAVMLFALAGWWLRRRSWDATLLFFWTGAFVAFFGWNVLFPVFRYWAPLVPIWIAFASYAIWTVGQRIMQPASVWRVQTIAVTAIVVSLVGWTVASGGLIRPQPVLGSSPAYLRLIDWFNRSIEPGDRVLLGPTREFYGLGWMNERDVHVLMSPSVRSLDAFLRYLGERHTRYVIMNPEMARGMGPELTASFADYVEVTAEGAIVEKRPLPGWRPVYADPGSPRRFIVYESDALRPAAAGSGEHPPLS